MTVRTELEELAKWIADLTEEEPPKKGPEHPAREVWQGVSGDLGRAADRLEEASDALMTKDKVLAEFALDLMRETEGLAMRAHVLSRRAKPRPKVVAAPKPKDEHEAVDPDKPKAKAKTEDPKDKSGGDKKKPRPASDLVASASDTIETANTKLGDDPDDATKRFQEELDVLAEMALSLRQRCEREG
jgi:hypothetical protein